MYNPQLIAQFSKVHSSCSAEGLPCCQTSFVTRTLTTQPYTQAASKWIQNGFKMAKNIFPPDDPAQKQLAQWLTACARKDAVAFRALYDACSPKLFGFALRIMTKREWAEEVLQDSFINIWNNAAAFQSGLSLPMTWMTTIVRNKAFDLLRKMRSDGATIELDADSLQDGGMDSILNTLENPDATPPDAMALRDDAKALAHCFSQLQGMHRQAIALSFYHDLSHSEVAEQLSLPMGTVKTWIRRGLDRLKTCLSLRESV